MLLSTNLSATLFCISQNLSQINEYINLKCANYKPFLQTRTSRLLSGPPKKKKKPSASESETVSNWDKRIVWFSEKFQYKVNRLLPSLMLTNNPIGLDILSFEEEILFGTALTNFSMTSRKINICNGFEIWDQVFPIS